MRLPVHVFHLAEEANFLSIQRHGLLSTSALLDLANIQGEERTRLERRQRQVHTRLPSGANLRDQNPMPPHMLTRSLVGMDPGEWYGFINSKVFFWLDPARLNRQRQACEPRRQVVLVVDTARLLSRHAENAALSPINSGNARRKPALRSRCTFVPYMRWLETGWDSEAAGLGISARARHHRPAELIVEDAVPDIMCFVLRVCRLGSGQSFTP